MSKILSELSEREVLDTVCEAFEEQTAEDNDYFSYDLLWEYVDNKDGFRLDSVGWTLKYVDNYGGEGKGDEYWYVFTVTDGTTTRHIKVDGGYASYYGGEYDKWFEVTPEERVVTVWVQK